MSDRGHRVVVVGCGAASRAWIPALLANPDCEVVGLVDNRPDAAHMAAAEHGLPASLVFERLEDALLTRRPDFICNVTSPDAHLATSVMALELGVPVLVEKPMADSMQAARAMVAVSERTSRLLMTSQSRRYQAHHLALRAAIAAGGIGAPSVVTCEFFIAAHIGGFRETMESPLLVDMAIHHFDLARYITRLDPVAVYAHEFNPSGSWFGGAAAACVIFEMTDGAVFNYVGSWTAEGAPTSWNGDWRIVGEQGSLIYRDDRPPHGHRVAVPWKDGLHSETGPIDVPEVSMAHSGIASALVEFVDALRGGPSPQGEAHDNIRSLAMVHAALESARTRTRVAVTF